MPTKPSKNLDVLNRRQQVSHLYLQNWTQAQIAEHLHVGQPTISADLKHLRRQWRESGLRDFDSARELELQKIYLLEREAWAAWERSKKPMQSATVDGEGADTYRHHHPSLLAGFADGVSGVRRYGHCLLK